MIRVDENDRLVVDVLAPSQALPVGRYEVALENVIVTPSIGVETLLITAPEQYAGYRLTLAESLSGARA